MEATKQIKTAVNKISKTMASKRARVILLIVSIVTLVASICLFTLFNIGSDHNDLLINRESHQVRERIINEGGEPGYDEYYCTNINIGSVELVSTPIEYDDLVYNLLVSSEDASSDFLNYNTYYVKGDYQYWIGFENCFAIDMDYNPDHDISVTSFICNKDNSDFIGLNGLHFDGLPFVTSFDYQHLGFPLEEINLPYEDYYIPEELLSELKTLMREAYLYHFECMEGVMNKFGIKDVQNFWENKIAEKHLIIRCINYGQLFVVFAPICAFCSALYLFLLVKVLALKRTRHFIKEDIEEEPQAILENDSDINNKENKLFVLARKSKLKPCIREWVFRAIGLVLLFSCSIYIGITKIYYSHGGDYPMWAFGDNLFESLYSLGSLILILIVVVVVAETHKHLFQMSAFFFILGFVYYVLMTSLLYAIEHVLVGKNFELLMVLFQFELPGNVFFGCGIFTFIGFFLFNEPNEALIKRKVFRLLSLLPVLLAVGSIIVSIEMQYNHIDVPYFISNFFFIKDPTFLFAGISFEYIIFAIRSRLKRKYGSQAEEIEAQDEMQMLKNLALCGLILVISLLTYCFPIEEREKMGLSCSYSIGFLSIPLFLFLKPSGKNRNYNYDWIYYLLFFISLMLPTIISSIGSNIAQ